MSSYAGHFVERIWEIRDGRARRLMLLGDRPPWWRVLARHRWDAAASEICEEARLEEQIVWREALGK